MLPELRQELQLHCGPLGGSEANWLIYDPVRHRYFEVPQRAFDLLQRWRAEPAEEFAEKIGFELERSVAVEDVKQLSTFIIANNLALLPPQDDARLLAQQEARSHRSQISRLIHNYLYFKVALFRPERFLRATLPFVEPLYSRSAVVIVGLLGLIGLYFASRQWDLFSATFTDMLSLQGAIVYGVVLIFVKVLHELGHAYTATRVGVRVNTMGVAFMVLTPILYTDVSDAWRLRERRKKIAIDIAGMVVELALAGVSIFLWAFLPDGPLRSAAFVTATTSLVMGLVVNLNPLMRFDGYHLLADAWRVPNLQSRSNDLANWWLREKLFDLQMGPPEYFPQRQRNLLIVFAVSAWIYRFLLFLGIALLVYHMFFKALGLILFIVEIAWFILLPIFNELKNWWKMRSDIAKTRRSLVTAGIGFVGLALFLIPWNGTIRVQGVLLANFETVIYAPRPARVASVNIAELQVGGGRRNARRAVRARSRSRSPADEPTDQVGAVAHQSHCGR